MLTHPPQPANRLQPGRAGIEVEFTPGHRRQHLLAVGSHAAMQGLGAGAGQVAGLGPAALLHQLGQLVQGFQQQAALAAQACAGGGGAQAVLVLLTALMQALQVIQAMQQV